MTAKRPISDLIGTVNPSDLLTVGGASSLFAPIGAIQPLDPQLAALAALDFTGNAGKVVTVNPTADGFMLSLSAAGASSWGAITGTLSSQADLKTALDGKAALSHTHAQSDITGLIAALAAKEGAITATTSADYFRGDKTFAPLNKTAVGLGNVDNTSDASKPVSTATATALGLKANLTGGNTFSGNQTVTGSVITSGKMQASDRIEGGKGFRFTGLAYDSGDVGQAFEGGFNPGNGFLGSYFYSIERPSSTALPLIFGGSPIYFTTNNDTSRIVTINSAGLSSLGTLSGSNLSGTNTGDETSSSILSKLSASSGGGTTNFLRADGTFAAPPSGGGSSAWGSITGTLSGQTDLQNALDAKASLSGATFTGTVAAPAVNASTINGLPFNGPATLGYANIGFGSLSLSSLTTGTGNFGFGEEAGRYLTTGGSNLFMGLASGRGMTTGSLNVGLGRESMQSASNASGDNNNAIGYLALGGGTLTTGNLNTAIGSGTGTPITTGSRNTLVGYAGGATLTTGSNNLLLGYYAGVGITTGTGNVVIGYQADNNAPALTNNLIVKTGAGNVITDDGTTTTFGHSLAPLTINQGNQTNVPALNITNLGPGNNGIQMGYLSINAGGYRTAIGQYSGGMDFSSSFRNDGATSVNSFSFTAANRSTDTSIHIIHSGDTTGKFIAGKDAGGVERFSVSNAGVIVAANLSGTNTGDETYSTLTSKLAAGSGGGTTNFLRADGTFAAPPAGGGGSVTGVTGTAPIQSSGGASPVISIVAASTTVAGSMSAADKTKLDAITGTNTGDQTKATLGLGNVDNTSDANKPVSSAQLTALNAKANLSGGNTFIGDQNFGRQTGSASDTTISYDNTSTYNFVNYRSWLAGVAQTDASFFSQRDFGLVLRGYPYVELRGSSNTSVLRTSDTGAAVTGTLSATSTISASNFSGTSSGTNTGDQTTITGNAGTATKLATARTINGVAFDGSAPITINAVDSTARLASSAVSAYGLTLIDDIDAATARTTLGLGSLATQSGTFSGTSSGTNTGDQTITLTGAVTGTGTGSFATTLATGAVALTNMANVATGTIFYRKTAATGAPEVQTLATLKTDLGLGGTNSGDQTISLTGDVSGSGTGSFAATVAAGAITLAKQANLAANTIIGNNTGVAATPLALTGANVTAMLSAVVAGGAQGVMTGSDKTKLDAITGTNTGDQTTITGNAGTATKLQTARTINGVAFDGSAAITINAVDSTARLAASAVSSYGLTLVDDIDAATARTTLGLGSLATQSGTFSGTSSGSNTGDQTITLTGPITGTGTGSFATTIASNVVTNGMLSTVATGTFKGRATAATGNVEDLTATQAKALLAIADTDVSFLQAGTGAISRTIQSRLRESVSLKDFGVCGNGGDDYAVLVLAINALNAGQIFHLYIPPGTYKHSAALPSITADGVIIRGAGPRRTLIKPQGSFDCLRFTSTSPTTTRISDNGLFDIGIDYGDVTAPTAGVALRLTRADRFYADNLDIRSAFQGLLIEGGADQHFGKSTITGAYSWSALAVGSYNVRLTNYTGTVEHPSEVFFENVNWKGSTTAGNNYLERSVVIECGDGVKINSGHVGFAYTNQIHINTQANASLSMLNIDFGDLYIDGNNAGSTTGDGVLINGSTLPTVIGITFRGVNIKNLKGNGLTANLSTLQGLKIGSQSQFDTIGGYHAKIVGAQRPCISETEFTNGNNNGGTASGVTFDTCVSAKFVNNELMSGTTPHPKGLELVNSTDMVVGFNHYSGHTVDMSVNSGCARTLYRGNRRIGSEVSVASADGFTLPMGYESVAITGTANMSNINAPNIDGYVVRLVFASTASFNDNLGNVDLDSAFTAVAGGTLTLRNDGTKWRELSRNPASGSGTVTAVSVTSANGVSGTVANSTSTPAISLSLGAITPTSVTTSTGSFSGNVTFGQGGAGAPTITTARSAGTKLILYDNFVSGATTDYAIGIDSSTFWCSVPDANVASTFKWFGGATLAATLTATGALTLASLNAIGTGGIGYGTGAGGTVTQATSRTTGVTLNKPCGAITLFSTTTTASQVTTFTVTNSTVAATDTVNVSVKTATGVYLAFVTTVAAGSFKISVFTPAAVGTAEAPVINYAIVKAAAA